MAFIRLAQDTDEKPIKFVGLAGLPTVYFSEHIPSQGRRVVISLGI
jgi:hypothetical protein